MAEYLDKYDINTINAIFEIIASEQKNILIEKTNERIIKQVLNRDFKVGVLLVNLFNFP